MSHALLQTATVLGTAVLLAGCGGAHTALVQVGVADESGQPLACAQLWVDGSHAKVLTGSTGNATLKGVEAGVDGYFRRRQQVTVESQGDLAPISIALACAPPIGTWQPKSTEWVALSITTYDTFTAILNIYEWGCSSDSWDVHQPQQVSELPGCCGWA
jgi:hypothetical protein